MNQQSPPSDSHNVTVNLYDLGQLAEALNLPPRTSPAEIVRRAAVAMNEAVASYVAHNGFRPWWAD